MDDIVVPGVIKSKVVQVVLTRMEPIIYTLRQRIFIVTASPRAVTIGTSCFKYKRLLSRAWTQEWCSEQRIRASPATSSPLPTGEFTPSTSPLTLNTAGHWPLAAV